mmetsp:Transcript_36811/g.56381  ORF Transcript_36811/g.56381 Transcript_36811/m.56381 type:complete len:357 (-) Transcript_36811:995-2065(-)
MRVVTVWSSGCILSSLLYSSTHTGTCTLALSQNNNPKCTSSSSSSYSSPDRGKPTMRRDTFMKWSATASAVAASVLTGSTSTFAYAPPNFPQGGTPPENDGNNSNNKFKRKTSDGAFDPKVTKASTTTSSSSSFSSSKRMSPVLKAPPQRPTVAYRSLKIDMDEFGVNVPVAMWYPAVATAAGDVTTTTTTAGKRKRIGGGSVVRPGQPIMDYPSLRYVMPNSSTANAATTDDIIAATYSHRISLKRIGQLLAGWDFIPEFVSKDFTLTPTMNMQYNDVGTSSSTELTTEMTTMMTTPMVGEYVMNGEQVKLPEKGPVVLLAHGYLGSRFDLSHLAEELANQGKFVLLILLKKCPV